MERNRETFLAPPSPYLPAVVKTGTVCPTGFARKTEPPRTLRVHVQIQIFEIACLFAIRVCGYILSVSDPRASKPTSNILKCNSTVSLRSVVVSLMGIVGVVLA